jgi:hypothetical protein
MDDADPMDSPSVPSTNRRRPVHLQTRGPDVPDKPEPPSPRAGKPTTSGAESLPLSRSPSGGSAPWAPAAPTRGWPGRFPPSAPEARL